MKLKSLSNKDRYGNMFSVEFFEPQNSVPMMMLIPEMEQGNGYNGADTSDHPGDPKGTDTVPAWLTPGENVVNAEASRIPGNQEMIDEMNDQGRAIQQSQGGPIPTYEADGGRITPPMYAEMGSYVPSEIPEWLTPDLLDSLMQVESGGDVNAVSRAGAVGPYQIMPKTAANPGYNTQAITEADMRDPDISRRFAQQYLAGIQANNPDFTPAEVLQAYNAGAGRIANFKAGKGKPLADETIEYADKVLGGIPEVNDGEVPVYDLGDQTDQAPGFMSAEASTVPASSASPFLQGMGGATQVPVIGQDMPDKGNVGVNNEIIRNGVSYKYDKETGEYTDAEGRDYRRSLLEVGSDAIDSIGDYFTKAPPANPNYGPKEGEVLVGERNGEPVYRTESGSFVQLAGPDKKRLGLSSFDTEDDIVFNKIPDSEREVVPPLEEPDSGLKNLDGSMPSKEAEETVTTIVKENSDKMTPEGDATIQQVLDDASNLGNEADPTLKEKVISSFKDAFKDLFTGKELARMAIIYTGSRLMGYSHEGSLGYSAKSLLQREAKFDTQNFDAVKANKASYTADSYNKFLKSRDMDDLESISTAVRTKKRGGKMYHRLLGVVPTVIGTDDIERVTIRGKQYRLDDPRIAPFIEDYQASIHDVGEIKKEFRNTGKAYMAGVNQGIKEEINRIPESQFTKIGDEANTIYNTYKKRYGGMGTAQRNDLMVNLNLAQEKYYQDYKRWIDGGKKKGRKPVSLEAYFKNQQMNIDTGGAISTTDTEGTDMKTIAKIDRQVAENSYDRLSDEDKERPDLAASEYKRIWKAYKDTWTKYTTMAATDQATKMFSTAGGDGKNAFMNWVEQCQQDNKKALEIFQIVKQ